MNLRDIQPVPPSARRGLGLALAGAAIFALGHLNLVAGNHAPTHLAWLPGGLGLALVMLWGLRMLTAVGLASAGTALWWTGDLRGSLLFGAVQAGACLLAWWLVMRRRPLELQRPGLAEMARFILCGAAAYALVVGLATALAPGELRHVRGDLAGAQRHDSSLHQSPLPGSLQHPDAPRAAASHETAPDGADGHGPVPHPAGATPGHAHHGALGAFDLFVSDLLGVLLVTPAVLALLGRRAAPQAFPALRSGPVAGERRRAWATLALLLGVALGIYGGWIEQYSGVRHTTLYVLPPAVWLALRHGPGYTLLGNLASTFIVEVGTAFGHGPFADHTAGLPLLNLVFVGTTLLMTASRAERTRAEHEIHRIATHDALTDLPNRKLLDLRLDAALATAHRYAQRTAVLVIDLDHFKRINDSLGHAVGDQLLVAVAGRLSAALRSDSVLARFGGDELVAVVERVDDPEDAAHTAARMVAALARPFELGPHRLTVACSIGVALFPDDAHSGPELIRHADIAMYQAKRAGGGQYRFFSGPMNEQVTRRLEVENGLRLALQAPVGFELHYQPIVDARSGALSHVEALLRWRQPDGELVAPGEFIAVAEETGLIEPIGDWVFEEAARQLRHWGDAGLALVPMSVNLSARQLRQPRRLCEQLQAALAGQGVSGDRLVLELTESMLLARNAEVEETLHEFRRMGLRLALDDFGTGYSSLAYLRNLPIDTVKIDRQFVREMTDKPEDRRLVQAIVQLAHGLNLRVVAEGVETPAQRQQLEAMGVDDLQGFLWAHPLPAAQFARQFLGAPGEATPRDEPGPSWGEAAGWLPAVN